MTVKWTTRTRCICRRRESSTINDLCWSYTYPALLDWYSSEPNHLPPNKYIGISVAAYRFNELSLSKPVAPAVAV